MAIMQGTNPFLRFYDLLELKLARQSALPSDCTRLAHKLQTFHNFIVDSLGAFISLSYVP